MTARSIYEPSIGASEVYDLEVYALAALYGVDPSIAHLACSLDE